jgi:hypothetical protein
MEARVYLRTSKDELSVVRARGRSVCSYPPPTAGCHGSVGVGPDQPRNDGPGRFSGDIPGLNSGGSDIDSWRVVAHGPIDLPPLSERITIGRIEKYSGADLPQEIVEPMGLGTPGAYVARVASRVYTQGQFAGPRGN